MKWLRRLLLSASPEAGEAVALRLEVRCARCGELIGIRVDTRYELRHDVENDRDVRVLDKDVLGVRCSALLHVHAVLAADLTVLSHEVLGGELVRLSR